MMRSEHSSSWICLLLSLLRIDDLGLGFLVDWGVDRPGFSSFSSFSSFSFCSSPGTLTAQIVKLCLLPLLALLFLLTQSSTLSCDGFSCGSSLLLYEQIDAFVCVNSFKSFRDLIKFLGVCALCILLQFEFYHLFFTNILNLSFFH